MMRTPAEDGAAGEVGGTADETGGAAGETGGAAGEAGGAAGEWRMPTSDSPSHSKVKALSAGVARADFRVALTRRTPNWPRYSRRRGTSSWLPATRARG